MKRLDQLQDRGARRLALELGTLALDKGVRAARSNNPDSEADGEVSPDYNVGRVIGGVLVEILAPQGIKLKPEP